MQFNEGQMRGQRIMNALWGQILKFYGDFEVRIFLLFLHSTNELFTTNAP
jgi:hypothetical protein